MIRVLRTLASLALACSLAGCAFGGSRSPPPLTVPVSPLLREPCPRPERPAADGLTVGLLALFSIRQEAAISVCDARRAALVETIDLAGKVTRPRPWWTFGR